MSKQPSQFAAFQLGSLRVEPDRNALKSSDREFRLEPRVMDVLCLLAETPGTVVSRTELIEALWPSEFGADESLTRAVSLIRKTLTEAGAPQPAVETIKKRGYRLVLPVVRHDAAETPGPGDSKARTSAPSDATRAAPARSRWTAGLIVVALGAVVALWLQTQTSAPTDDAMPAAPTSIVVLPFEALSDNDSDIYFGAGVAEELLNALARLRDLRVVGRTSAFTSSNAELDPKTLGDRLNVDHIVTGTVRRNNDRIRISVQLLRASDSQRVWAERYDIDETELFSLEDEIVLEIAQALQVRLGVGAAIDRSSGRGVDPTAYEQYLQGLRFLGDRMRRNDNRARALDAFQQAVAFDPDFADAWAGIGTLAVYSVGSPLSRDREAFTAMTEHALQRAIDLDPDNAQALAALVVFNATQKIDIDAARRYLQRTQTIAPTAATTHYTEMVLYRTLGDAEGALDALDRTIVLDPLNPILRLVRASLLTEMRRYDEAMDAYESCFQSKCLAEGFVAFASAAAIFSNDPVYRDRWLPRINEFEALVDTLPDTKLPTVARVMPAFSSIRYDRADKVDQIGRIRQLFRSRSITDTIGIWGPTFASHLPEDTFIELLHLAYERGDLFSATFGMSPMYGVNRYPNWVREHPRYQALWQRPGMPELAAEWRRVGKLDGLPLPVVGE